MGEGSTTTPVPFVDLQAQRRRLGDAIEKAIARVLEHGQFIMGPEVRELEDRLADFAGARHVVTCSSGTDALLLALMAWGIGPGDAVFVPAMTFSSTPEVAALLRATPVLVDVDDASATLSAESLSAAVDVARRRDLRPTAVIAVDLHGLPADYERISSVAARHDLLVLGDAAQSFGAEVRGSRVGTLAPITATSFFPAKPLGGYGDGGAVMTDDPSLASAMRSLREHGRGDHKHDVRRVGVNGRLDTLQAAVVLQKLTVFRDELVERQAVARRYTDGLAGIVETPTVPPDTTSAWAHYAIRVDDRDEVAARLMKHGVPTAVHYPRALHQQPAYADAPRAPGGLGASERLAERLLSLPIHPYLDAEAQDQVIEAVHAATG